MTAIDLPANLVDSVRSDVSTERREWLRALPHVVSELAARWSLHLAPPFQPGGRCAWVAPGHDAAGRDLVLKVSWRHDEAADEAAGLRIWAGRGAARLYASVEFGETSALLLERCRPGDPLAGCVPEPEQDDVIAALLRQLWTVSPDRYPFRPLRLMCDAWVAEFWKKLRAGSPSLDRGLMRTAAELFRTLSVTAEQPVLLCTDLHAGNVLSAERSPWIMIDPKPYLGDPTYDVLQHMLNCEERLIVDPVGFAARMADLLDLELDRLIAWLFARCVLESLDEPALAQVAERLSVRLAFP